MAPRSLDPDRSGIAIEPRHYAACMLQRPAVGWLELDAQGVSAHALALSASEPAWRAAAALRAAWPVGLHVAGFALGTARGLDHAALDSCAERVARLEPARVVVALAWPDSGVPNPALNLPYDDATLARVAADVDRLHARLRRPVLIENPPARPRATAFATDEAHFLSALVHRTGCGLAVDLANLLVSSANRGGEPLRWLATLPGSAVGALRVAGHGMTAFADDTVLIADRSEPPGETVRALHATAVRRFPGAPTVLAWATPQLARLAAETARADRRRRAGEDAGLVLATALARNVHATGLLRADESGIGAAAPFPGVAARIRTKPPIEPGDDALPRGADIYLVKRALAARDDAAALAFLASCRRTMARHTRLVLLENLVSRESFAAAWFASGAQARASRTVDDVGHLLAAAGLRATQFTAHPAIDLLEATIA